MRELCIFWVRLTRSRPPGIACLRIISFNANGLRSAASKGFFDWFGEQDADLLCVQETKAQEHQLTGEAGTRNGCCPDGYKGWFRDMFTQGVNGPVYGFLLDHFISQDIVDISDDGTTAWGRFRCLMQAGSHETKKDAPAHLPSQWWEGGIYENEYVRENGVWKIKVCNYNVVYHGLFETGWAHTPVRFVQLFTDTYPNNPGGPDELVEPRPVVWPETSVVPFHYEHPVTGKKWQPA